ncbi:MAG TPA: hypothetical protein VE988_16725, partial [Gemmataceae bacterium]|nr:hypothetical protein [Gemmataceae bacterium]
MLNVRDATQALHTKIHASRVDYLVAALSDDPETIAELQTALARFLPEETSHEFFGHWRSGINEEPWDAGVCVIDLAAKLVAMESTYAHPGPIDGVEMEDPRNGRQVGVRYHVADDWMFQYHMEGWDAIADSRRRKLLATPPLDARVVLYGKLCQYIA